jgi:DNA-binding transcriptional ArsR family regulator
MIIGGLNALGWKRASIALALMAIVVGCFVASMYQQKSFRYGYTQEPIRRLQVYSGINSYLAITIEKTCLLAFPSSFTVQAPDISQLTFTNSTRLQIFEFINENPGIQFRAVCAGLCLPLGLAQYHLGVLVKAGLLSFVRDGRYKRFFVSKKFSRKQMLTISLLRHKTVKKIVEALICKKQLSHGKLASEVSITSQALTWQMKSLRNTEFILQTNDGLKKIYSIDKDSALMLEKCLAIVN